MLPRMNLLFFVSTTIFAVLSLTLTIWSGQAAHRRTHYTLVCSTVLLLVLVIAQAEPLGRGYAFDPFRLGVHLACAFAALASFPGLAWSGFKLRRSPSWRASHRRWLSAFLALLIAAVATSLWMFLNARQI